MNPRVDPSLIMLYEQIKTDELLAVFLKKHGLISKPATISMTRGKNPKPIIGYCRAVPFNPNKPACTGAIVEVLKKGHPIYRCTICKNEKSAHNGPSSYDPNAEPGITVFNSVDVLNRPNRKISPRDVLYMTFCLAYEIPPSRLSILTGSSLSKETLTNWGEYLRDLTAEKLFTDQPKMGGVGDIVEIDESYLKGRRKANRGRYQAGNVVGQQGHRRNNFMGRAQGPWIFGLICRRTKECRMFYVPNRAATTFIPIVKHHVAPGSTIVSDEWRAYNSLSQHGFHHMTVNHSQHFVDPLTGASTQMIERQWKKIKLPLLKYGPGVAMSTIRTQLTNYWWLSINGRHMCTDPFLRYVDLIAGFVSL